MKNKPGQGSRTHPPTPTTHTPSVIADYWADTHGVQRVQKKTSILGHMIPKGFHSL